MLGDTVHKKDKNFVSKSQPHVNGIHLTLGEDDGHLIGLGHKMLISRHQTRVTREGHVEMSRQSGNARHSFSVCECHTRTYSRAISEPQHLFLHLLDSLLFDGVRGRLVDPTGGAEGIRIGIGLSIPTTMSRCREG